MLKSGDKTIVTVSSVGAHLTGKGLSAYQPSKLAVLRLMEFVGAEYGEQGVVAYCVHPGNVVTDIVGGEEGLPPFLKPGEYR
jgi:NAD(P)-dependent dehydrogenase (short-subunit alcohol dehydrogenase family)